MLVKMEPDSPWLYSTTMIDFTWNSILLSQLSFQIDGSSYSLKVKAT